MKRKKRTLYLYTFCKHRSRRTDECPFCGQPRSEYCWEFREMDRRKQRKGAE